MTLDQAELILIEARNVALTAWGNRLLDGVADPAFAAKLIKYARELEAWHQRDDANLPSGRGRSN
jgi:hypothetical protein